MYHKHGRGVTISHKEEMEIAAALNRKLKNNINDSEMVMTIKLLKFNAKEFFAQYKFANQILVVYKDFTYEILSRGVIGGRIKDYLGIRVSRIRYWSVMPMISKFGQYKETSDLYDA